MASIPYDDQEDSDFFEKLESDLGDGGGDGLQSSYKQGEDSSLSNAFSKLSVLGGGSGVTSSSNSADAENSQGDDFWLDENLEVNEVPQSEPVFTEFSQPSQSSDAIPSRSVLDFENSADHNEIVTVVPNSETSVVDGNLESRECPNDQEVTTTEAEKNEFEESNTSAENSSLPFSDDLVVAEDPSISTATEDLHSSEVENPLMSVAAIENVVPEDSYPSMQLRKESKQASDPLDHGRIEQSLDVNSVPVDFNDDVTVLGSSDSSVNNNAVDESISCSQSNSTRPETVDEPGSSSEFPSAKAGDEVVSRNAGGIKEVQWSTFSSAFQQDTYPDFFSDLGSHLSDNCHVESREVESLSIPSLQSALFVPNENPANQYETYFSGQSQVTGEEFWNQQETIRQVVNENVVDYTSMGINSSSFETQQQAEPSQENMYYPGWYYDYSCSQWKQIEGWDSTTGTIANEQQTGVSDPCNEWKQEGVSDPSGEWKQIEGWNSGAGVEQQTNLSPSYEGINTFLPQYNQNQGEEAVNASSSLWSASGYTEGYGGDTNNVSPSGYSQDTSNVSASVYTGGYFQDNNNVSVSGYMGAYGQNTNNVSVSQEVNWQDQYPGWYYDYQSQQWRQIDASSQGWVPDQQFSSQVGDQTNSTSFNANSWTNGQGQVYTQAQVNNSYADQNQSSITGGEMHSMCRGMSFNSWTQPVAAQASANVETVQEPFQSGNAGPWLGFQSVENIPPTYSYESQMDHNLADRSQYVGNQQSQQSFFSSYTATAIPAGAQHSSEGRPPHALVGFGFGGKLVTIKASQSKPEPIVLHDLNQLVVTAGKNATNHGTMYFSALNRQGLSCPLIGNGVTNKELLKWIEERIENCEFEDPYCTSSEGLRVLWGVLKIACMHYGKLRSVGVSGGLKAQAEDGPDVALGRLLAASKSRGTWNGANASALDALLSLPTESQLQSTAVQVRMYLMDGKKKEALQLAQQGQLWGLALVLASQLGEKAYSDTILEMAQQQFSPGSPLRTLLLLFAGQTAELFNSQSMSSSSGNQGPYQQLQLVSKEGAGGMLVDWLGNLSVIAANPTKGDEQVITHLGDSLWKEQGEVAGAHTCYIVADASFESFSKQARLCLLGADHFKHPRTFATPLAIQRTELFEYAKALGNPQYVLVPFQPYKLLYAHMLAEAGKFVEASRYCQMVIKALKSAGRAPEFEFCRQSASALEDRIRLFSQSGYSLNFKTGKIVGKVMGTIDSTIHKIIGGPPPPPQSSPSVINAGEWFPGDQKYGNVGTPVRSSPMVPSVSNNNLVYGNNNQVDMGMRSVSEPNLSRSPVQDTQSSAVSPNKPSPSSKQSKNAAPGGGYLGRLGSNLFSNVVGLIKHNKKQAKLGDENKFYYDEKLKRWVEAGAEPSAEEVLPPPPPMTTNLTSSLESSPTVDTKSGGDYMPHAGIHNSSAEKPPMPPSVNQFSARSRNQGVRSRYVDTFNKGNSTASPSKSIMSPIVPNAGWTQAPSPSSFFTSPPLPTDSNTEKFLNGHMNDTTPDGENLVPGNSISASNLDTDQEPLMPKNLSSSFMAVPLTQRHSSVSNLRTLMNNETSRQDGTPGNIPRTASWSGESLGTSMHKSPSANNILPSPPVIESPATYTGFDNRHMPTEQMASGGLDRSVYGEMQEVEF